MQRHQWPMSLRTTDTVDSGCWYMTEGRDRGLAASALAASALAALALAASALAASALAASALAASALAALALAPASPAVTSPARSQPPILAEELWSCSTVALPNGSRWKAS